MATIFNYKIKKGTASLMSSILCYPECCSYDIDGEICRITAFYDVKRGIIKDKCLEKYNGKKIYQVKLLSSEGTKEHLVLETQLEYLEDFIIVK